MLSLFASRTCREERYRPAGRRSLAAGLAKQQQGFPFRYSLFALSLLLLGPVSAFAAEVQGTTRVFTSVNGVSERCVALEPLSGAIYPKGERSDLEAYCSIDVSQAAMCPKLWSTSPGTLIYALHGEPATADIQAFERLQCPSGHHAKDAARKKLATFKVTANGRTTSATFAPSSWVYYHLARFLHTQSYVPPSVYREIDRQVHLERVSTSGLQLAQSRRGLHMLSEGWQLLVNVESSEETGLVAHEALTADGGKVFGVLLDNKGDRYGVEFNGTRESGWGKGQNRDFQRTGPYLALRTEGSLPEAMKAGVNEARRDPIMAKALKTDISKVQLGLWMNDLLEITLLDYILGQQDRIGNIDWFWTWVWLENGELKRTRAHNDEPPKKLKGLNPIRVKRTAINDNDAGVRGGYANFARSTAMLDDLRHYNPKLYLRLHALNEGLQNQGPIYQWLRGTAGLSERQAGGIASRAGEAWAKLSADCESGALAFDLIPERLLDPGLASPTVPCLPED